MKKYYEKKTIENVKVTKLSHAYKDYASTFNVDNLNSFNPEIQLENSEFTIKNSLKDLLSELRGFKFAITLVSEFLTSVFSIGFKK